MMPGAISALSLMGTCRRLEGRGPEATATETSGIAFLQTSATTGEAGCGADAGRAVPTPLFGGRVTDVAR